MNKAITDGVVFMPPSFAAGLDRWSSGDGSPGSDTYDGAANAGIVASDTDFGSCLELLKSDVTTRLRFMGQTPVLAGTYLQVTARIKAVSGNLPTVRIAGRANTSNGSEINDVNVTGPEVTLTQYGQVATVRAIVGSGHRNGVDMAWGPDAASGYFGLDLTGPSGGIVRIDDIEIIDITQAFHRDLMNWIDVRDYGAIGDGTTDNTAAFQAADAAAEGKRVLVPTGKFFLANSVTLSNPVQFEGTIDMPDDAILSLTKSYDLPTYINAFGNEALAFRKAVQALLNNSDHESLDMGGRRISLDRPVDMQAAVPNRSSFATRRHIRNGQIQADGSAHWDDDVVQSTATYSTSAPTLLTNVVNVANIQVGSLLTGHGVGREVYVRAKDVDTQQITLSAELYDAEGTQTFTFTRFKYLLDFSGFASLSKFSMSDIEFQCSGHCSGILMAPAGLIFQLRDCFITRPKDRGLTSPGDGCQGMLIDRCQFLSDESNLRAQDRISIALNTNANDVKLRNNRIVHFRHFAIVGGASSLIIGNHWFQGDSENDGLRLGGLILTKTHNRATITGNYIDNCFVEWSNEHDSAPEFSSEFSFSSLSITGNTFIMIDAAPWSRFIVIKPHGAGHFIHGLNVTGNMFRSQQSTLDRVEAVDESFATLNTTRFRNITIDGNAYNQIAQPTQNPARMVFTQGSASSSWTIEAAAPLPFGARAKLVDSVVAHADLRNHSNVVSYAAPSVSHEQGSNGTQVVLRWPQALSGQVALQVRGDSV